jgi:hypothetical protein
MDEMTRYKYRLFRGKRAEPCKRPVSSEYLV